MFHTTSRIGAVVIMLLLVAGCRSMGFAFFFVASPSGRTWLRRDI